MSINFKQFSEALVGNQHKLDKNKNGKLDADDFKKLRKEEELDEAGAYQKDMDEKKPVFAQGVKGMKSKPFVKKFKSQQHYEKWADSDAAGDHEVHRVYQEGVEFEYEDLCEEQIDEISKQTKLSYFVKATTGKRKPEDYKKQASLDAKRETEDPSNPAWTKRKDHWTNKAEKRQAGIDKVKADLTKEEVELEEAINADHYRATSEPSQFGGHRPKVVHKTKGTTMYLGQHGYKTKSAAAEGAKAYLDAYEKIGDNAASRAAHAHAKNHPDAIKESFVPQDTKLSYKNFMSYIAEATVEDDEEEQGEEKLEKTADKKADKLGRKRSKDIHFNNGEDDGKKSFNEDLDVIEIDEGRVPDDHGRQLTASDKNKLGLMAAMIAKERAEKQARDAEKAKQKPKLKEEEELDEGEVIKTATGVRHKGTYGSEYETDREGNEKKKVAAPAEKRGRGRPKKGSDNSGNVKKYTFHDLLNRISK